MRDPIESVMLPRATLLGGTSGTAMNVAASRRGDHAPSARKRPQRLAVRLGLPRARILIGRPSSPTQGVPTIGSVTASSVPEPSSADATTADGDIAIVVLTHNRVHLLAKCVENVLQRTSPATREIVIWNNGSVDATAGYLDSLDDPRISVVSSERNIGQNAYSEAFRMTSAPYFVELDDDVVDAPACWDAMLLDAFKRLPSIGFLAADLEDDPHDLASRYRHHIRPHEYEPVEENGVRLLRGPTGGGCAITSRELNERVGGFRQDKKRVFWLEDAAYIADIERLGYGAAVLADLRVHHTGGPHYTTASEEKLAYWRHFERRRARRSAVKRVLYRLPVVPRLNARFEWFQPPS
jgi:GT2 family glycosyltransferase